MREGGGHGLRDSLLFYFLKAYLQYTPKVSLVYLFTFFFLCMYFSFHHRGGDHARAPPRLGLTCHARIEQTITTCTYQPTCTGIAILDGEKAVTWFSCAPTNTFVLLHRDSLMNGSELDTKHAQCSNWWVLLM